MENKKLIRFVESLVLLPITTFSLPFGNIPENNVNPSFGPEIVFLQKLNTANDLLSINQEIDQKAKILEMRAFAIDAYFKKYDMPLFGTGMKMVQEAEKNNLDWRLLPGIATIESTGGKFACKKVPNNPFGWGSCKPGFGFESMDESIENIALHLGGNKESTAKYYKGKNTREILQKYNPPTVVHNYADKVIHVMNKIGAENLGEETLNSVV